MIEHYELSRRPATSLLGAALRARASNRSRDARASTSNCCSTTTTRSAAFSRQSSGELETALTSLSLPAGGPLERLRLTLQAQFEFLARHPQMVALLGQGSRPGGGGGAAFAPAINRLVVLLAEGQGLGQVRDDLDPHLAAAQALILMVGYLSLEAVVAASARPLGADEPALRERWREAAVELVVGGVSAR